MNILAVIPARAGSRGIPNKNIRIVGDHPLVYYSIMNALHSKWITDVIVSTDSVEVGVIARQLGVCVHWRDSSLCGDAVTLDAVVADAVPAQKDWDYIVTMQPTSPTLRAETLDRAIQYAIKNDLDTVISVWNAPHLSWSEKDGKKVPNYAERLNRQYLPPWYMETGAFMISRASAVTPATRIGEKVDVFEVPEDESYDVDTFEELKCAAAALSRPQVGMYVASGDPREARRIRHALELADEFYVKPDIYYDASQIDPKEFGGTRHRLLPVNGAEELFKACAKRQYTLFINDLPSASASYMARLRSVLPGAKIIQFDDGGEGACRADLVINALLPGKALPQAKSDAKYYIGSKTCLFLAPVIIKDRVKRVFISFGASDPRNYALRLLRMIRKPAYQELEFFVVLGKAKDQAESLIHQNPLDNIKILDDGANTPEAMSLCDIGITSRGETACDLAILGIPAITMAQDAREEAHDFIRDENGFLYLGFDPSDESIESALQTYLRMSREDRQLIQDTLLRHDLRGGRKRVMALIRSLEEK